MTTDTATTLYGLVVSCGHCGTRVTVHDFFVPTGLPGWNPDMIILASCGDSLAAADAALSDAARTFTGIGRPVPVDTPDGPLLFNGCAHCGKAITVDMITDSLCAEGYADERLEIERTVMPGASLDAALHETELVGRMIIDEGVATMVGNSAGRECRHEPGGMTISTRYTD